MDQVIIQNSLNAGELSPSVYGRSDVQKYHDGCTTARNFFANYRGGMSSRAGLAYVGTCKQQYPTPPRDIPFQFNIDQGYVLEFGDNYMRVKYRGAYVTETQVTGVSVSTAAVFTTAAPHGYSIGDWIYNTGNSGFSNLTWIVNTVPTANTLTVRNLYGNVITSATVSSGGEFARVYTATSPYLAVDLPYLKYTQSADIMTLTCVNTDSSTEYVPYNLARVSNTNWVFTAETFTASIAAPTSVSVTAQSSGVATTWYSYTVTAVDADTGEESVAATPASVQNNDISLTLGTNTISWQTVSGAASYNVYAATPSYQQSVPVSSLYGFVGTALGTSFVDTNIIADFTKVPPVHNDPFVRGAITGIVPTAGGSNYDQSTIGYSITTSTGSGFAGQPVVSNGSLNGFVIYNHGKGYASGDTIAFTDSGGGKATGTCTFPANPADTNSMRINGVAFHFATSPKTGDGAQFVYAELQSTVALTVQTLANILNSSNILSLSVATYTASGNVLTITYKTPGAIGNSFTMANISAGMIPSGATLTGGGTIGSGATASLSIGPSSRTYPSVSSYFSQRRVYASSLSQPDTYWMSKPGLYNNFDFSIPITAGDSITGTPWAQQVNSIQFMQPMPGGLVVLTGKGAWQVNGGQSAAITPSNQTATPQAYNGCHNLVQPIPINYDILYLQSKGSIWRDLSYNFFTNIYTGADLTTFSNHLFTNYTSIAAAYAEEPYKLVWIVRNDGRLLCLTYVKEQEVTSWTRHDTNGLFVGVCSVTEPPVDAVYFIVQRYIQGAWRYYSERMDDRVWNNVEDAYCVDAGLTYAQTTPGTSLIINYYLTDQVTLNTPYTDVFLPGMVGDIVRADGGVFEINTYDGPRGVFATIIQDPTSIVQNDPDDRPIPTGSWTISHPTTTVTGLNHLEGLTVTGLADGSVIPETVVSGGSITLPNEASQIVVGLPYTCQVQTMFIDAQARDGTMQNRRKNISSMGVRVEASRGLQIGADQPDAAAQQNYATVPWTHMTLIKERTNQVNAGIGTPLFTGDFQQGINSGWNLKGQMALQQIYPLPANVLAVVAYVSTGDDQ